MAAFSRRAMLAGHVREPYARSMPLPPLVEPVDALSDAERLRTARHQVLSGLGEIVPPMSPSSGRADSALRSCSHSPRPESER